MKQIKTMMFGLLLSCSSIALWACSAGTNQVKPEQTENSVAVQSDNETSKKVGFVEYFNNSPRTILFGVTDKTVDSSSEIMVVYEINKGKMSRYSFEDYEGNSIEDLSQYTDEEILEMAKENDEIYFKKEKERAVKRAEGGIEGTKAGLQAEEIDAESAEEAIKLRTELLNYYNGVDYQEYRKPNTNIRLSATVATNPTGDSITERLIYMPYVNVFDPGVINSSITPVTELLEEARTNVTNYTSTPLYDEALYEMAGYKWLPIHTKNMLLSRQLADKNLVFELDKVGTKGVREGR